MNFQKFPKIKLVALLWHPGTSWMTREKMANFAGTSRNTEEQNNSQSQPVDRLKTLYPAVNEEETPLPKSWSPKDKYNYIGLSQNNLRVHYKGQSIFSSIFHSIIAFFLSVKWLHTMSNFIFWSHLYLLCSWFIHLV